jgi:glycosyltransferase involved in cell wall biosynthesis
MCKIIREEKPSLVNVHFCNKLGYLPFFIWLRRRGIKLVFHYHGEILPLSEVSFVEQFISEIKCVTAPSNLIVTVSKANKNYLEHKQIRPSIKIINNGIDLNRFCPVAEKDHIPEELGGYPFNQYLIYIGTMVKRKRVDYLLKVFGLIADKIDDLGLIIVGGGGHEKSIKRIADQMDVGKRIIFKGLLQEYPFELLKNASLMVSASMQESFGLIFAEALAMGVPVVACRVGGIPEVVKEDSVGYLLDQDDLNGFVDKTSKLLTDRQTHRKFSLCAREWVTSNFNLKSKILENVNTFQKVLKYTT